MKVKMKETITLAFMLVALLSCSVAATALPSVDWIKINDHIHEDGDVVVVDRGDELDVDVKLQAGNDSHENVEVEADILGYEFSDHDASLSDSSHLFDMDADDTRFENLELQVPVTVDRDTYDLRIRVGSRRDPSVEQVFRLRIEGERHQIQIKDVIMHPNVVEAGSSLLVNARVRNRGEELEDDVKVTARLPALGLEDSDYISELEVSESQTSEELFMRIPACTMRDMNKFP